MGLSTSTSTAKTTSRTSAADAWIWRRSGWSALSIPDPRRTPPRDAQCSCTSLSSASAPTAPRRRCTMERTVAGLVPDGESVGRVTTCCPRTPRSCPRPRVRRPTGSARAAVLRNAHTSYLSNFLLDGLIHVESEESFICISINEGFILSRPPNRRLEIGFLLPTGSSSSASVNPSRRKSLCAALPLSVCK